jgi:hypothetical protein
MDSGEPSLFQVEEDDGMGQKPFDKEAVLDEQLFLNAFVRSARL